jgi:glucose/arabinose dehydrogenase
MKYLATITLALFTLIHSASAAPGLKLIAKDLNEPLWATATESHPRYLYILEKKGIIKILDLKVGKFLPKPFLDITEKIHIRMNEQGLLGMAFCPNFSKGGRFYLNYTDRSGDTQIARYLCNPELPTVADPASEEILLSIKQDSRNHNGGWIGFGPDQLLYIAMGDGGSANDPKNRGQDMKSLLGKVLRIDVSRPRGYAIPSTNPYATRKDIRPEIFSHGVRNPWRCCWDPLTRAFYLADVGQNKIEEINYLPSGKDNGADYGWRLREGHIATPKRNIGGPSKPGHVEPIYTYDHGMGPKEGLSVTGGFVYRGKIQSLQGHYFFADWINPRVWSFKVSDGEATQFTDWSEKFNLKGNKINRISSFGRDAEGELYIMDHLKGTLFKIVDF